jgi:hypothetical protein
VEALGYGGTLRREGDGVACAIGSLYGGVPRTVVVALEFPPAMAGTRGMIGARVVGVDTATGGTVADSGAVAFVHEVVPDAHPSPEVVLTVTRQWLWWLTAEASRLNDLGDLPMVRALLDDSLPRLRAYVRSTPEAQMMVLEAEHELRRATDRMDARARKEMYVSSRKPMRGERELREW